MTDQAETSSTSTTGEGDERVVGTNLTTVAEYSETALALAALEGRFANLVVDVSTKKGLEAATKDVAELRTLRTSLEKRRKELKAPLLLQEKALDSEAARLTAKISALEEPIKLQVDAENARIENARLEKLEAERLRVEAIAQRIDTIRNFPGSLTGKPSVIIAGQLDKLKADELVEDEFGDQFPTARDALTASIHRIEQLLQAQLDVEAERRQAAENEARMKDMQVKLDAQQKLIDDAAAEKAERERQAAAEEAGRKAREAAEQRQREIDAQAEIDRAARAEREAQERADREAREEQERIDREERARLQAEEDARLQVERERQAAAQKKLDEQAEQLRKDKAAAAKKAEAERLKNLGVREAAQAVVDHFDGRSDVPSVVVDLAIALTNEAAQVKPARGKKAAQG